MSSPITRFIILLIAVGSAGVIGWQLMHRRQIESTLEDSRSKGDNLLDQGRYTESERFLQDAVDNARKFGDGDPRVDTAYLALADAQSAQGKYSESGGSYLQLMANRVARLGPNSAGVAEAQEKMGENYLLSGDLLNAEGMFNQALETWEKCNAINNVEAVPTYVGLARTFEKQGKLDKAEDQLNRGLAILDRVTDSDKALHSAALRDLARVTQARGNDAHLLLERAKELEPAATIPPTIEPSLTPTLAPPPTPTAPTELYQGRVP